MGASSWGSGAGWNQEEHQPPRVRLPGHARRASRCSRSSCRSSAGSGAAQPGWSFEGKHYQVDRLAVRPDATQRPRPPLIVGTKGQASGSGWPRASRPPQRLLLRRREGRRTFALLDRTCAEIGRDPAAVTRSVLLGTVVGEDRREAERRLDEIIATFEYAGSRDEWRRRTSSWLVGSPDEVTARSRTTTPPARRCSSSRTSCPTTCPSSTSSGHGRRLGWRVSAAT